MVGDWFFQCYVRHHEIRQQVWSIAILMKSSLNPLNLYISLHSISESLWIPTLNLCFESLHLIWQKMYAGHAAKGLSSAKSTRIGTSDRPDEAAERIQSGYWVTTGHGAENHTVTYCLTYSKNFKTKSTNLGLGCAVVKARPSDKPNGCHYQGDYETHRALHKMHSASSHVEWLQQTLGDKGWLICVLITLPILAYVISMGTNGKQWEPVPTHCRADPSHSMDWWASQSCSFVYCLTCRFHMSTRNKILIVQQNPCLNLPSSSLKVLNCRNRPLCQKTWCDQTCHFAAGWPCRCKDSKQKCQKIWNSNRRGVKISDGQPGCFALLTAKLSQACKQIISTSPHGSKRSIRSCQSWKKDLNRF